MATRSDLVNSSERARVLLAAFAEVPGPSSVAVRAEQLLQGLSSAMDFDALTLKASALQHIERLGNARLLRVPVGDGPGTIQDPGHFRDRLSTFRRALGRQLESERYDVVVCLDMFSAATATPLLRGAKLVVDVADLPSTTFSSRWPVRADDDALRRQWEVEEAGALGAASALLVPSRQAGRTLSARTDPLVLRAAPRLVDTRLFAPPTMELASEDPKIVVWGGRDARRIANTIDLLQFLARLLPRASIDWVGHPSRTDARATAAVGQKFLRGRVELVDAATVAAELQAVHAADLIIVPAGGEGAGWGVPHRVLQGMATERAVVVGGLEAAYKDTLASGTHACVVDGNAEALAIAAREVLDNIDGRRAMAKNGRKQALRFDYAGRLSEVAQILRDVTGLPFVAQVPPLATTTSLPPVGGRRSTVFPVRAQAHEPQAAPLRKPEQKRSPPPPRPAPPAASPPPEKPGGLAGAAPSSPPGSLALPPAAAVPSIPPVRPPIPPAAAVPSIPPARPAVPADHAPLAPPTKFVPPAAAVVSLPPVPPRPLAAPLPTLPLTNVAGPPSSDEPSERKLRPRRPTTVDAARVKAALLHTASGEAVRPLTTAQEASSSKTTRTPQTTKRPVTEKPETSLPTTVPQAIGLQGVRSLTVVSDLLDGADDWSRDTVADASPVEPAPTRDVLSQAAPRTGLVHEVAGESTDEEESAEATSR
jgi:glycosyltransferase involved in cell wall biosynthesis